MGAIGSSIYGHVKKYAHRYNAEFRTHKFLDKGNLPRAPRHPTTRKFDADKMIEENPSIKKEFEELNRKNEQLNDYLKKVYLTSNKVEETKSKKPLPVNRKCPAVLFYEPETPSIGSLTMTVFVKILLDHKTDPKKWTISALATKYALSNKDVVNLLLYYSLYRQEKFDFMRAEGAEQQQPDDGEKKKIEFEVYKKLEHKPLKRIEQK